MFCNYHNLNSKICIVRYPHPHPLVLQGSALCSHSSVFPLLWDYRAVGTQTRPQSCSALFPRLYVPTALCSHNSIVVQQLYIPTIQLHVPTIMGIQSSGMTDTSQGRLYVSTALCSHSSFVTQLYVPTALQPHGSMFPQLYRNSSMFPQLALS